MCRRSYFLVCIVAFSFSFASFSLGQGLGVTGDLIANLDGSKALRIRTVLPNGLASQLGVLPGDVILSINRFPPGDAFVNQRAIAMGGGEVAIVVSRQGVRFELGNRRGQPSVPRFRVPIDVDPRHSTQQKGPDLLVDLDEIHDIGGYRVRVRSVTPGGRGAQEGFKPGDIIESINRFKVRSLRDVREAYVFRNGQITITYLRGGRTNQITLTNRDVTRKTLGLTTVRTQKREVKVTGYDPKGLGLELGIATRGTIITKINGTPVLTPGDIKRVDQAIVEGRITYLEIEYIPPGGQPKVARCRL